MAAIPGLGPGPRRAISIRNGGPTRPAHRPALIEPDIGRWKVRSTDPEPSAALPSTIPEARDGLQARRARVVPDRFLAGARHDRLDLPGRPAVDAMQVAVDGGREDVELLAPIGAPGGLMQCMAVDGGRQDGNSSASAPWLS